MRNINISFEEPQINVNGTVFDLKKADYEICEIVREAQKRCEKLDRDNPDEILAVCRQTAADVDSILGEGAVKKLSSGRPVSIVKLMQLLALVAAESTKEYQSYVSQEYLP